MRKITLALLNLAMIGILLSAAGPYQTANADSSAVLVARLLMEECTPNAIFVADVTVPDDSVFEPGESFEKVWRLKNIGDCEWSKEYALTFTRGDQLSAPDSQTLGETVAAGETVDIGVKMTAPDKDGVYTGYWQMADAEGTLFGVEIYVRIVVETPPDETPEALEVGWVTHQIEEFELALPETWEIIPMDKEKLELIVKIMKETNPQWAAQIEMLLTTGLYEQFRLWAMDTESVDLLTNVNVIYLPVPMTARVYVTTVKKQLEGMGAKVVATDDDLEINGLQAGRIDYEIVVQTFGGDEILTIGIQYAIIVDVEGVYIVTFGTGEQQREAQSPVFERIANSFSLIESE